MCMNTGDVRREATQSLRYLWVLQECRLVVSAATAAVQQRLCMFGPAPKVHDLVPRLVDTEQRSIDEAANVCVREELAPVCERHPVDVRRKCIVTLWRRRWTPQVDCCNWRNVTTHQNSPSSSTVMPRSPLSISPTFDHSSELTNTQAKQIKMVDAHERLLDTNKSFTSYKLYSAFSQRMDPVVRFHKRKNSDHSRLLCCPLICSVCSTLSLFSPNYVKLLPSQLWVEANYPLCTVIF